MNKCIIFKTKLYCISKIGKIGTYSYEKKNYTCCTCEQNLRHLLYEFNRNKLLDYLYQNIQIDP